MVSGTKQPQKNRDEATAEKLALPLFFDMRKHETTCIKVDLILLFAIIQKSIINACI